MRKETFLKVFCVLVLLLALLYSALSLGNLEQKDDKTSDPSSPSFDYASADWSAVSSSSYAQVDWTKVPTTAYTQLDWTVVPYDKIPLENTGSIPKEKIDVTKVRDQSKLNSEQLLYNKNLNKISDVKKLDEQVLRDVLSQYSGIGFRLQAGDTGTKVTLRDGGIVEIDKGTTLSVGDTINGVDVSGFTNARYANGFLLVESGALAVQKKNDEVLTTTQVFQNLAQDTVKKSMVFDSAKHVIMRYSTVHNVKKTVITQKDESTTLLSLENQDFTMNNKGEELKVKIENQGSITTSKDSTYTHSL